MENAGVLLTISKYCDGKVVYFSIVILSSSVFFNHYFAIRIRSIFFCNQKTITFSHYNLNLSRNINNKTNCILPEIVFADTFREK